MMSKLPVVWITGLAGSGKTTLAELLVGELRRQELGVVHVDGDKVRKVMGGDLGYGTRDRLENAWRIARLCAFLQGEGVLVVCSTMSLYREIWQFNRSVLEPYLQVYLDVPMRVLAERDQKGLYSAASLGRVSDVGGVDLQLELPLDSHLVLANVERHDLARNLQTLLSAIALAPGPLAAAEVSA